MKSGYIDSGTAKIYYEIYGEGRNIVFLHGNGEDMTYFKHQKDALKNNYRLIFIDSRGHGKSSFGDEKLSLDLMSNDIIHVLNELKIDKSDFLGFSDGGNLALMIAMKKSDILNSLTVVGANLKPEDLIISERIQIKKEIELEEDDNKKAILKLMINEPNIEDKDLNEISTKTLVVAGEKDLIEEDCTKRIASNIKDSSLKILKDADHFLIDTMPDKFNSIFEKFLNAI